MSDQAIEIPAIPDFNPKMVRRASRRGVARAALIAALIVGALFAAVDFGTGAIARAQHPSADAAKAFSGAFIAHPGYQPAAAGLGSGFVNPSAGVSRTGDYTTTANFQQVDTRSDPVGAPVPVRFHKSLFGSGDVTTFIPATKLETAILFDRPTKDATRRVVAGLPASTVASAAVEFATPMSEEQANQLTQRLGVGFGKDSQARSPFDAYVFTAMHPGATEGPNHLNVIDGNQMRVIAVSPFIGPLLLKPELSGMKGPNDEPKYNATGALREFAGELHASDSHLMIDVGLPPVNELQAIAKDGKIYGFTMVGANPAQIAKVLNAPEVRSVAIADAELNTSTP